METKTSLSSIGHFFWLARPLTGFGMAICNSHKYCLTTEQKQIDCIVANLAVMAEFHPRQTLSSVDIVYLVDF